MRIVLWKRKYVVYDDDGKVVIMCHNKRICQDYAERMKPSNVGHFSEKQEDGSFKLAIKHTNTWNSEVNIDWEVISISSTGKIDWNSTKWGGIAKQ